MNRQHRLAQSIVRAWPFPYGSGRIIDRLFGSLRFRNSTEIVSTGDGFRITIDPNDHIGRHIYLSGSFDRAIVDVLCTFAEPSDVLLDIGANIGYVSACFLKNVPDSKAIAVEPQPGVLDLLNENLGRFPNSVIYPYALGEQDSFVSFSIDTQNKGASHVSTQGELKVEMRSAARMFDELNITRLDIIKIDAEGCEGIILRSSLPQIKRLKPRIIVFEDLAHSDFGSILKSAGYRIYGIRKHLHKLTLNDVDSNADIHYHDYVAVSDDREIPAKAKAAFGI